VRTIPAVRELHQTYRDSGLIVIGMHTPEFNHEHDIHNVQDAMTRLDVPYPVALDNDYRTWRAFKNRYWPSLYLIDKRGVIRYHHIGELHVGTRSWDELVNLIEQLQSEPGS
jgi:alkyl hydroperoxide reductase subunit AhpC